MKGLLLVLAAIAPAAAASAQFDGGDPDCENGLSPEKNRAVFDGFLYEFMGGTSDVSWPVARSWRCGNEGEPPTPGNWGGLCPIGIEAGRAFVGTEEGGDFGDAFNDDESFFTWDHFEVSFGDASDSFGLGQAGFSRATAPACYADCDRSGELDVDDFICFQTLFGLGDAKADCDSSGSLDIDDFICFQTAFGVGCP